MADLHEQHDIAHHPPPAIVTELGEGGYPEQQLEHAGEAQCEDHVTQDGLMQQE